MYIAHSHGWVNFTIYNVGFWCNSYKIRRWLNWRYVFVHSLFARKTELVSQRQYLQLLHYDLESDFHIEGYLHQFIPENDGLQQSLVVIKSMKVYFV